MSHPKRETHPPVLRTSEYPADPHHQRAVLPGLLASGSLSGCHGSPVGTWNAEMGCSLRVWLKNGAGAHDTAAILSCPK